MVSVQKTLITHSGTFHADDIFACATLQLFLDHGGIDYTVLRTRDEALMATGDYVFDVGAVYDHDRGRYDHHQVDGAGQRPHGVPYSAFGLVWKHYGSLICDDPTDADTIDETFVQFVDANDSGYSMYQSRYSDHIIPEIDTIFGYFRTTWTEDRALLDIRFLDLVVFAKQILQRLVIRTRDERKATERVEEIYRTTNDPRLLILDQYLPWHAVAERHKDILFVVYPSDSTWHAHTVEKEHFVPRHPFPDVWGGLMNAQLQVLTGVPDALFAHTKQFLVVATSREGVIDLVHKALT